MRLVAELTLLLCQLLWKQHQPDLTLCYKVGTNSLKLFLILNLAIIIELSSKVPGLLLLEFCGPVCISVSSDGRGEIYFLMQLIAYLLSKLGLLFQWKGSIQ